MTELYLIGLMQSCKHSDEVLYFSEINQGKETGKKKISEVLALRTQLESQGELRF